VGFSVATIVRTHGMKNMPWLPFSVLVAAMNVAPASSRQAAKMAALQRAKLRHYKVTIRLLDNGMAMQ